jgi:hypothetical protein
MQLALEIPKPFLPRLSALTDLDFALAHLILEDADYAAFYLNQSESGRFVIMDNSFHELGHPLSPEELREAAQRIKPTVVIAPDKLGDYAFGMEAFLQTRDILPRSQRIAFVLAGASPAERAEMFMKLKDKADMVCLPFRAARLDWFLDLTRKIPEHVKWPPRIHLLGVSELKELSAFRTAFATFGVPHHRLSVDSAKPCKFGLLKHHIHDSIQTLRGLPSMDKLLQSLNGDGDLEAAFNATVYNVAFLRRYI